METRDDKPLEPERCPACGKDLPAGTVGSPQGFDVAGVPLEPGVQATQCPNCGASLRRTGEGPWRVD
jgi:predicted RNA-binding Zn-ribbon protein involved in translation (DUF1610 family)